LISFLNIFFLHLLIAQCSRPRWNQKVKPSLNEPKEAAIPIPLVRPRVGPILYNRPRGRQRKVTQISSQEVHKKKSGTDKVAGRWSIRPKIVGQALHETLSGWGCKWLKYPSIVLSRS